MNSTLFGLFLSGTAILGLAITIYIILIIAFTKQANTVSGILLCQLAITECILCILYLVCSASQLMEDPSKALMAWSSTTCTKCGFGFTLLRPIAVWTVCALNCDRYYAISAPLHYGSLVNSRKVLIAIAILWSSSLTFCLLPFLFETAYVVYNSQFFACVPKFHLDKLSFGYYLIHIFLVFLIPLILIIICNLKVFLIAYHKHRIASAIFEVTLSAQVTITHQRNPFRPLLWTTKFRGRKACLTVLQLVGSFLILYVPYYSIIFWNSINNNFVDNTMIKSTSLNNNQNQVPSYLIAISYALVTCSSPINGLLYGIKSKILRKSFQNYWRKKMTKSEVNQEIQARTPSTCGSRRPSISAGFFARQSLRRTSEISIETQKSNLLGVSVTKLHQCLSDISSRPGSSPGLGIMANKDEMFAELKRTHSFHTNNNNLYHSSITSLKTSFEQRTAPGPRGGSTEFRKFQKLNGLDGQNQNNNAERSPVMNNHLMQKSRKIENSSYNKLRNKFSNNSRSPRILITRAFSEENEPKTMFPPSPKTSCSVTTLLIDNTWKIGSQDGIFIENNEFAECSSTNSGKLINAESLKEFSKSQNIVEPKTSNENNLVRNKFQNNNNDKLNERSRNNFNINSWPCDSTKRRNIKFCLGSSLISFKEQFESENDEINSPEVETSVPTGRNHKIIKKSSSMTQ